MLRTREWFAPRQRVCAYARLRLRLRQRRGARGLARCGKARRDETECGVRRGAWREARGARRGAARPSTSLSLSERMRVLAGARSCSQVSRTPRNDHQTSKQRGYIWGRFAASFWLGISKTPPLFEILRSALRACSGSMSTSMSMGTSTSTSTSMSTSMNRSMNMRTSMSMSMSTYRKRFLNLKKNDYSLALRALGAS